MIIKNLRLQIIFIEVAAFFLVTAVIVGTLNYKMNSQVIKNAHQVLTMLVNFNGHLPSTNVKPDFDDGVNQTVPKDNYDLGFGSEMTVETQYTTRYFYVVLDNNGNVTSDNLDHIAAVSKNDIADYVKNATSSNAAEGWTSSYRYLKVSADGKTTIYYVDCYSQRTYAAYLTRLSLMVAAIGMLFACLFVYILSGKIIQPMEESFQKQKRFITDASHELKTPLAAISANVDVLELQSGENDTTKRIRLQIQHLSNLINEMLSLSRISSMKLARDEIETIDLSALVQKKTDEFLPLIETQGKHLTSEIKNEVLLNGNRKDLDRLLSVLMDNAAKYCLSEGNISIVLSSDSKSVHFSIINSCDSIGFPELGHLFDRFYRTDSSRSRDTGSFGIGLSIAEAIVKKHNGKISARNVPEGVKFEFELPLYSHVAKQPLT